MFLSVLDIENTSYLERRVVSVYIFVHWLHKYPVSFTKFYTLLVFFFAGYIEDSAYIEDSGSSSPDSNNNCN